MKLRLNLLAGMMIASAGCSRDAEQPATNNAVEANAATAKKHPTYCFFKDAETKGWSAVRDRSGNVSVTGKAHVKDARYKAVITDTELAGSHATLWLTINENTGYAAPEDWWDVSSTIPESSAVTAVTLQCGKKVVAELNIPH